MQKIIIVVIVVLMGIFIIIGFVRKQAQTVVSGVKQVTMRTVEEIDFVQKSTFGSFVASSDEAVISAQVGGNIDKIYVAEGDNVVKGQILAHISTPETAAQYRGAQAQVQISQEQEKQARRHWDDYKPEAREQFSLRTQQAEAARSEAGAILAKSRIVAPFSGIVSKKYITVGETVIPGSPIIHVVGDESTKEVTINVPIDVGENSVLGETVSVVSGDQAVDATIIAISPVSDKFSRKTMLRIAFAPETPFVLGSFVDVIINDSDSVRGMKIPKEAVVKQYNDTFVFIVKENIAQMQSVKVLGEYDADIIVSGLIDNDKVIVAGAHGLQSGDEISIVTK